MNSRHRISQIVCIFFFCFVVGSYGLQSVGVQASASPFSSITPSIGTQYFMSFGSTGHMAMDNALRKMYRYESENNVSCTVQDITLDFTSPGWTAHISATCRPAGLLP
ncbi:MAG: hypothetical protein AAGF95_03850 [Chloroflexota bacterium]